MAYASKYYDPVKAHEYYMKHRQLKGRQSRTSTAGLNEMGKIAAKEVKEAIMADRKKAYDKLKEDIKKEIEAVRREMKHSKNKARLKKKIAEIRERNKSERAKIKEAYQEQYLQELDKIKQDSSFLKYKKGRKK